MKTVTRYVNRRMESGIDVVSVSITANADSVRVEIPFKEGMTASQIITKAIQLASPNLQHLSRATQVSAPSAPKREEDELVFNPDEITPYLVQLLPMMVAVACKPIRLELTSVEPTASTDCKSIVNFNPEPYLKGRIEAGNGRGLHEASHIAFSPRGAELIARAQKEGGERLGYLLNLIMDRRDDDLNCKRHRGYAMMVRRRLADLLPGPLESRNGVDPSARKSVYMDFAYACKKRTRPHHKVVRECIGIVNREIKRANSMQRLDTRLLVAGKRVKKLLDKFEPEISRDQDDAFCSFMFSLNQAIRGQRVSWQVRQAFRAALSRYHASNRKKALGNVAHAFKSLPTRANLQTLSQFGGAGGERRGRVICVQPDHGAYASSLVRVRQYVPGLRRVISELALPCPRVLHGLDEGELDFDALAVLVTGGRDCMMREEEDLELDLAIAFLNDVSGSRDIDTRGIDLGVAFNEALLLAPRSLEANFLAFHDDVFDCGPARPGNGIAGVKARGSTDEAFGLSVAGQILARSQRRRKLVFVACDGGPNDRHAVERECKTLMSAGILPIRLLIGVDASPKSYPVELFFGNYAELFKDLESLFRSLLFAARS